MGLRGPLRHALVQQRRGLATLNSKRALLVSTNLVCAVESHRKGSAGRQYNRS